VDPDVCLHLQDFSLMIPICVHSVCVCVCVCAHVQQDAPEETNICLKKARGRERDWMMSPEWIKVTSIF